MARYCAERRPASLTAVGAGLVILVGLCDYWTGTEISFSVFYLLPVGLAAWFAGRSGGVIIAGLSGLVWLAAELASVPSYANAWAPYWNALARLGMFGIVALTLARLGRLHQSLEGEVRKRTELLEGETAQRLNLEREIVRISHEEQERIARYLHDSLCQEVGGVAFQTKRLATQMTAADPQAASQAQKVTDLLNHVMSRLRSLSHLLDPSGETGDLDQALSGLATDSAEAFGMECTFGADSSLPNLTLQAKIHLYRIAQQSVHNACMHGQATRVEITLRLDGNLATLAIKDNGRGFDPATHRGAGRRNMRFRATALQGSLQVKSAPGQGCEVVCSFPLDRNLATSGSDGL